jgi:hypothetical protein
MEAAIGVEPMNEGFADLCLSHLATPPDLFQRTENRGQITEIDFSLVCLL